MTRWLPVFTVVASCIVAYDYHINPTGWYDLALFFLPLTCILTIGLMRRLPDESSPQIDSVSWKPFTRWQVGLTLAGLACFIMIAQVQGTYPAVLSFLFGMHHSHQFLLWILGIGLVLWGMSGGLPLGQWWQSFRHWLTEPDARWLCLFMVLCLFVRVVLSEQLLHLYTDEANFALPVARLRTQPNIQLMNHLGPVATFTWIYSYFQYFYTELFGATLANLRGVSVIVGTLTIPATYLLGRWTFNRRIGLLVAFLLTFYLPHIHFSRLALNNIADPLIGVLAMAFLWRGLKTGSRRWMAFGGIFLGLTGYFYEGGRLLYPALMIGWLVIYTLIHNAKVPKRSIAVFLLTAVIVSSGFYLSLGLWGFENVAPRYAQQNLPDYFWAEFFISDDALGQLSRYIDERINPPYLLIMSLPDGNGVFYSSIVGLVLAHMLPFLLIGIGRALYCWRSFGLMLPLWIMLTVLGNSLIVWNNFSARFVVVFPGLVLLIAIGLDVIYQSITLHWLTHDRTKLYFRRGVTILLGLIAVSQIGFYFGVIMPEYNITARNKMDSFDATFRAQDLADDTLVYILPIKDFYRFEVVNVQLFERHTIPVNIIDVADFDFDSLDTTSDHPYAFFIERDDTDTLNQLKQIFGNRLMGPDESPYYVPSRYQFMLYQVNP